MERTGRSTGYPTGMPEDLKASSWGGAHASSWGGAHASFWGGAHASSGTVLLGVFAAS